MNNVICRGTRVRGELKLFFLHWSFIMGIEVSVWSSVTFPSPVASRVWIKQKPALFQGPWELTWFHQCSKFPLGIVLPDSQVFSAFVLPASHPFIWLLHWTVLHAYVNSWTVSTSATSGWPRSALAPLWAGFDPVLWRTRSPTLLSSVYMQVVVLWSCAHFLFISFLDLQNFLLLSGVSGVETLKTSVSLW